MTATIISNTPPFGALTNQAVAGLHNANEAITRLADREVHRKYRAVPAPPDDLAADSYDLFLASAQ